MIAEHEAPIPPPIKSIPTLYKGTHFRSRLEAKWAAWFDLVGWNWIYEPIDLEGWAPDFSIEGYRGPIYCEVKPVISGKPSDQFEKASRSAMCETHDVLLLGTAPTTVRGMYAIGMCNEADDGYLFRVAAVKHGCPGVQIGYCSEVGWYGDRITGFYDGFGGGMQVDATMRLWGQASNAVQWSPK